MSPAALNSLVRLVELLDLALSSQMSLLLELVLILEDVNHAL